MEYELLAPVGDFRSLRAAVESGADAVYFGIRGFNMRDTRETGFLEVVGCRSLALVGGRFKLRQHSCQSLRLGQFKRRFVYEGEI